MSALALQSEAGWLCSIRATTGSLNRITFAFLEQQLSVVMSKRTADGSLKLVQEENWCREREQKEEEAAAAGGEAEEESDYESDYESEESEEEDGGGVRGGG